MEKRNHIFRCWVIFLILFQVNAFAQSDEQLLATARLNELFNTAKPYARNPYAPKTEDFNKKMRQQI
jgi:hypothetical protein